MSIKNLMAALLTALVACSSERNMDGGNGGARIAVESGTPATGTSGTTTVVDTGKVTVLFFGTSLTAGYGLDPSQAFPVLIERKSATTDAPITAVNAGLSGETSAGAVRRIDWALKRRADVVVIETGGNDALRALNPDSLAANISTIVDRIRTSQPDARIMLAVMEAPPNLGGGYTGRFRRAYTEVSNRENIPLIPFLLEGVAGKAGLNQADGVHPNVQGERIVAENVWRYLEPVVREVYAERRSR